MFFKIIANTSSVCPVGQPPSPQGKAAVAVAQPSQGNETLQGKWE